MRTPLRPAAARSLLTLAAIVMLATGCTGDGVNLSQAEADMTNTALDVIVQVSGDADPNVTSKRVACQDDLLRDNGLERASVSVGLNIGADRDAEEVHQAVVDVLDEHGISNERGAGGFVYADAPGYGLSIQYYPHSGLLVADGTTECG